MFIRTRTAVRQLGQGGQSSPLRGALRRSPSSWLRVLLAPSPFALSTAEKAQPVKPRPRQACACVLAQSARRRGEGDAGSVTSPSPVISIRGHDGLPGVSDRAFYAASSATFWSSASCLRPQLPTPLPALLFLVSFHPGR